MADKVLPDGTYTIVNMINGIVYLDTWEAQDEPGSNVVAYPYDNTNAEFVSVITLSNGDRRLIFPATGQTLDIFHGAEDDWVHEGQNVRQWEFNDTGAQRFAIVPSTKTYAGSAQAYQIRMTRKVGGKLYAVATDPTSAKPASIGGEYYNVYISDIDETKTEQPSNFDWVFKPANPVPDGVYRIVPKTHPDWAIAVKYGSVAMGAQVVAEPYTDDNSQKWYVHTDRQTGLTALYSLKSWFVIELWGDYTNVANGARVQQWGDGGASDQRWLMTPYAQTSINGNLAPTYLVRIYGGSGTSYVLDIDQYNSLCLWAQSGSDTQQFAFVPVAATEPELGTPAGITLSAEKIARPQDRVVANNVKDGMYCLWTCPGTTYKAAYRYRARKVGATYGGWSAWMSMAGDNLTANQGLGDSWKENLTVEDLPQKHTPAKLSRIPVVDNITYDQVAVETSIQRFARSWSRHPGVPAHGPVIDNTITLLWQPNVHLNSATWSPDGLRLVYISDYKRWGNSVTVSSTYSYALGRNILRDGAYTQGNLSYSGTVTVPIAHLLAIPKNGDTLDVTYTMLTEDMSIVTHRETLSVSYNTEYGLTVTPTYTARDDASVLVSVAVHTEDSCWISYFDRTQDKLVFERARQRGTQGGEKLFVIYPPINQKFDIYVVSKMQDSWGTVYRQFDALQWKISSPAFMWNWLDQDTGAEKAAAIFANVGKIPQLTDARSSDMVTHNIAGRDRPRYSFNDASERNLSVKGSLIDDNNEFIHSTKREIMELQATHFALWRSYTGDRAFVAVKQVSDDKSDIDCSSVVVEQYEDADPTGVV